MLITEKYVEFALHFQILEDFLKFHDYSIVHFPGFHDFSRRWKLCKTYVLKISRSGQKLHNTSKF